MPALLASALFHWPCSISIHFVSLSDFFTFVSQVRCLRCWRPPFFYSFVSQAISLLLSPRFGACTAGVRLFPLAMQHFYSVVSRVIFFAFCLPGSVPALLAPALFLFICLPGDFFTFVSQVRCLHCWCPPFSAGHATFLFSCLPCDSFNFCLPGSMPAMLVSALFRWPRSISIHLSPMRFLYFCLQVRCLRSWCPPFSAGHAAFLFLCFSCDFFTCLPGSVAALLASVLFRWPCSISIQLCLPGDFFRSPFLLVIVSAFLLVTVSVLSPFCFLLSPFLLVIVRLVSLLSRFVSGLDSLLVGHCVRLVSLLFPFSVSLLVDHCVRLVSLLFPFVSLLVSVLVGHCVCLVSLFCFLLSPFLLVIVRLVFLLVSHVSKNGLRNASLLSHLFGVYGGVIFAIGLLPGNVP